MVCKNIACSKEFDGRRTRQYCSRDCKHTSHHPFPPSKHKIEICANTECGKEFIKTAANKKSCSKHCAYRVGYTRAYVPAGSGDLVKCAREGCPNTFTRVLKGTHHKKYCSRKCNYQVKNSGHWAKLTLDQKKRYTETAKIKRWHQSPHGRYRRLCGQAKQRGIEVGLTEDQYIDLVREGVCFYCSNPLGGGTNIDRYDRKQGYFIGNCRPCCWRCNEIKGGVERWFPPERCVEFLMEAIQLENAQQPQCVRVFNSSSEVRQNGI